MLTQEEFALAILRELQRVRGLPVIGGGAGALSTEVLLSLIYETVAGWSPSGGGGGGAPSGPAGGDLAGTYPNPTISTAFSDLLPTADEKAALDAAPTPLSGANPVASMADIPTAPANELQAFEQTGNPDGGGFTVAFGIYGNVGWNWNTIQSDLQLIFEATFGAGGVLVSGNADNFSVEWIGAFGNMPIPQATLVTNSLTGGTSPNYNLSTLVEGVISLVPDPLTLVNGLLLGAGPYASQGDIRYSNPFEVYGRNAADDADVPIFSLSDADDLYVGNPTPNVDYGSLVLRQDGSFSLSNHTGMAGVTYLTEDSLYLNSNSGASAQLFDNGNFNLIDERNYDGVRLDRPSETLGLTGGGGLQYLSILPGKIRLENFGGDLALELGALPTADPSVTDQIWNRSGLLVKSGVSQEANLTPLTTDVTVTLITQVASLLNEERARINALSQFFIDFGFEAAS